MPDPSNLAGAVIAGLLSAGAWQFLAGLLRRKPELDRLDAETESLRLTTADRLIDRLDRRLQAVEARNQQLVDELGQRDQTIVELEERLHAMRQSVTDLQRQLTVAETQLAALRGRETPS